MRRVSPFAYTSASSGPRAPLGVVVDESDADQILAIDELRALRDRMGTEPAAPTAVTSAAPIQPPDRLAASLAARDDVWEDLRRLRPWRGTQLRRPIPTRRRLKIRRLTRRRHPPLRHRRVRPETPISNLSRFARTGIHRTTGPKISVADGPS